MPCSSGSSPSADVVTTNWRPGAAARLGLDFETLHARVPAARLLQHPRLREGAALRSARHRPDRGRAHRHRVGGRRAAMRATRRCGAARTWATPATRCSPRSRSPPRCTTASAPARGRRSSTSIVNARAACTRRTRGSTPTATPADWGHVDAGQHGLVALLPHVSVCRRSLAVRRRARAGRASSRSGRARRSRRDARADDADKRRRCSRSDSASGRRASGSRARRCRRAGRDRRRGVLPDAVRRPRGASAGLDRRDARQARRPLRGSRAARRLLGDAGRRPARPVPVRRAHREILLEHGYTRARSTRSSPRASSSTRRSRTSVNA